MARVASDESNLLRRRAGAARLIDWTGERCVPWAPDAQVVYEHFHRYLWAARLVPGRRVLDLASGEGFGAAILAGTAAAVVGVDIDARSVEHSTLNYEGPNLSFAVADARELGDFVDGSFGAVVAFEMIEHIEEHGRLLDEIQRVLEPGGLLIVSTPDREAYDEASGKNPFHVHELGREEFVALLRSRFANVAVFGQRTITGSALAALEPLETPEPLEAAEAPAASGARSFFIERGGDEWRPVSALSPMYVVAIASNAALPVAPRDSTLADGRIELVRQAEAGAAQRAAEGYARNERALRQEFAAQQANLLTELEAERQEAMTLRTAAARDADTISALDAALNELTRRYARIEASVTWQTFQRIRNHVFGLLGGEESRGAQAIQRSLRYTGRKLHTGGARAPGPAPVPRRRNPAIANSRIKLPQHDAPDVSIVIPLYAHADLTRSALESIRDNTHRVSYEVILVDDAADRETKALLERVDGARAIVNETNQGYLRSMQHGAADARGRWLVLCNNDIEVEPGWLSAMIDCAESERDVAIVTPKFIYPDGSLAEAGGIIWRDGTGANYGRGGDPGQCYYQYRRDVDYGSAAALMVKRDFWREVGGFDERFLPMYYEDTDLCFEARALGLRVMFEPLARVVHIEGATAGVDETSGHKRHQDQNRPKFVEKWRERLQKEHLPNDQRYLWAAANLRRVPHVLVVDHRMPMWDRESGALRMRGILQTLIGLGCHVAFLPDNLMPQQPYTRELQRLGVEVLYGIEVPGDVERIGPSLSLVILSRPQVAGRWLELVREHAPAATVAYDTVDLHWLREARRLAGANGTDATVELTPKASAMRELELGLIRASDVTIVVSDSERRQVQQDVPGAVVHVLPNVNEVRARVPPPRVRQGVLFVGGFEHPPNVEAALMLVRDVMPIVWSELGDVGVEIVGSDPPPEVEALASSRVNVRGWVPDLDPLLGSARALVAPLRYGAGLKGKVTQALAAGLPVVTTPIGAEGLDGTDGEQLLIGSGAEELAERTIRVIRDDALWSRLSRAGQVLAGELCSPAVMQSRVKELLQGVRSSGRPDPLLVAETTQTR
jgi:GT2 family glycosyltransferase/SAM-dependent methyltransferase